MRDPFRGALVEMCFCWNALEPNMTVPTTSHRTNEAVANTNNYLHKQYATAICGSVTVLRRPPLSVAQGRLYPQQVS